MSLRDATAVLTRRLVLLLFAAAITTSGIGAFFSGTSYASGSLGDVGTWQTTTVLPVTSIFDTASVTYNSYAYLIGGAAGGSFTSAVYYAPLHADGSVGTWLTSANSLPISLNNESAVAYNGFLYVIGGDSNSGLLSSVYYAALNNDGSVGAWQTNGNTLPSNVANGAAVEANGYLYLFGGDNSGALTSVYYALVNSDGSVGAWQTGISLASTFDYATAVLNNGYVYVLGGTVSGAVLYAQLSSNGSVGAWQTAANVPTFHQFQRAAGANGYLFVYGGRSGLSGDTSIQSAPMNSDGSVGSWTTSPNTMVNGVKQPVGFAANGYIYSLSGGGFSGIGNDVEYTPLNYTDQVTLSNNGTASPVRIDIPQGNNISCNSAASEASLAQQDSGYTYPLGLIKYCFTTNNPTDQVGLIFVTNLTPSQVVARDYNSTTGKYVTIPGVVITETSLSGEPALQLEYTIADGGALDEDGLLNQSITDPVGLAVPTVPSSISAPDTGYGAPQRLWPATLVLVAAATCIVTGLTLKSRKFISRN